MNEGTHDVTLTDDESAAVQKALLSYLRELRGEIVDTDNSAYKRDLREERAQLESAIAKLGGPDAAPPTATDDREPGVVVTRVVAFRWTT